MTQYEGGPTIEENLAKAIAIHHQLLRAEVPNICPHLSGLAPSAWSALTPAQWLAYDEAIIDRCTHLLMLPHWQMSKGARHEWQYAVGKRMPIANSVNQLLELIIQGIGVELWDGGVRHGQSL